MRQLGYESNKTDPDLWMMVCTQDTKSGPENYYLSILIYADDILCTHNDPNSVLAQIDNSH